MPRTVSGAVLCVVVALAAACASSPPSRFYTLSSHGVRRRSAGAATSKLSVVVGPVSMPAVVDLPQIVVSTGPNQVTIDEYNRWASPLPNNISRVVAENLVDLLGTPRVSLFQQSLNADADYRVAIEVQTFESAPGDAATLNAVWLVRRARDGKSETGRTTVREPTAEKSYDALAAAHSRALSRMSQDIAGRGPHARPRAVSPCARLSAERPAATRTPRQYRLAQPRRRAREIFRPARAMRGGMRRGFSPIIGFADAENLRISPRWLRFASRDEHFYCGGWTGQAPAGWHYRRRKRRCIRWYGTPSFPPPIPRLPPCRLDRRTCRRCWSWSRCGRRDPSPPEPASSGTTMASFEGGRLVAMAGERMAAGAWREISGVCTHPDVEGRGLAWRLIAKLVRSQMQRGETPFLHVMSDNVHARRLYERMGFRFHQEVAVRVVSRL